MTKNTVLLKTCRNKINDFQKLAAQCATALLYGGFHRNTLTVKFTVYMYTYSPHPSLMPPLSPKRENLLLSLVYKIDQL